MKRTAVLSAGLILVVGAGVAATQLGAWNASADAGGARDGLSAATLESLRTHTGDVLGAFDPKSPSRVHTASGLVEDHRSDVTITLQAAEKAVAEQLGLAPAAVAANQLASLTSTTTTYDGEEGRNQPGVPVYDGTAVWALEYDAVRIRRSGPIGGPDHDSTYLATMVVLVDAYTGEFLVGDQV